MTIDLEIFGFFADEAQDSLEKLEASGISLIDDPAQRDEIESIFRTLHNLKGTSKALGLEEFGNFIHEVEDYFLPFKAGEEDISLDVVSLLLEVQETLIQWISSIRESEGTELGYDVRAFQGRLCDTGNANPGVAPAELHEAAPTPSTEPPGEAPPQDLHPVAAPAAAPDPAPKKATPAANESIRVNTGKIDELLKNIAELTIASSMIEDAFACEDRTRLGELLGRNRKMLKDLQSKSFELRMNSLSGLFQRIHRAGVQIASKQEKNIDFIISGQDVELDRSVIDVIGEALTHVIRNAVDHGIEDPKTRADQGKPARATVHIIATQEADSVQIEIRDDGKGMDPDRLRAKAVEKGLLTEVQAAELGDSQAFDLIFHSGFSTAEQVTDVSGRGVGMSAVKDTVESLSGDIEIVSRPGEGSAFLVSLPTTVSIIDGVGIRLFDQNLILPIRKIKEIVALEDLDIREQFTGSRVASFRGAKLNIQQLDDVIVGARSDENAVCFIIEKSGQLLGLVSPRSLNMSQVVVKGVGSKLSEFPYFNGVTILGNGEPAFILDVFKIHDDFYHGAKQWRTAS